MKNINPTNVVIGRKKKFEEEMKEKIEEYVRNHQEEIVEKEKENMNPPGTAVVWQESGGIFPSRRKNPRAI